jgi:hypothetical protein
MFRPLARSHRRPHRRGTSFVLIVVVMISFAASVGVAFALFAGQTLRINDAVKAGQGGGALPQTRAPEPTGTLNRFFSALLFGVGDDSNEDLTNALRGNEIVRSMYSGTAGNTTPWNGVGTFREPNAYGDRSAQVNYTQMMFGNAPFLLDPEVRGTRPFTGTGAGATRGALAIGPGREFVGKNAGYSYADLKDFFAGVVDPGTGQVLTPSFHRPWLWNTTVTTGTTTTVTTLGPDNPNWTNTNGRMLTLRPRPAEHPRFPRVPANADGSYTGDVQNWPGGFTFVADPTNPNDVTRWRYYAKNDSLWMHIGLPTVQFGNRKVQPLVAPLIVPLDGLLNASVHGNNYGPVGPNGLGTHLSHSGFGPWEVNVGGFSNIDLNALPTDRANVVGARGAPPGSRSFDPYRTVAGAPMTLPPYSPVAWNNTVVTRPTYPTGNNLRGVPDFATANFQSTNALAPAHPAQFNPAQWSQFGSPRVFPMSDIKRLHLRYAFTPDWYTMSDIANNYAQNDLFGTSFQFPYATGRNTINSYRLDPAHTNRALFTTRGFSLDRPKIAPNFLDRTGAAGLAFPGLFKPNPISPGTFPIPGSTPGAVSDFPSAQRWVNKMAALGAVDLNRPLADYRVDKAQALSAAGNVTVTSAVQADNDRRKLAHDIFVRLAAATGAALQISLTGVEYPAYQYVLPPLPPATPVAQYNALRYLAQLAVNIVDYRDDDDINTGFVWNPLNGNPNDPNNFTLGEVDNRVVFGVEKPRLVINEVYSEITNDPGDPANGPPDGGGQPTPLPANRPAHVKFWVELLNPGNSSGGSGLIDESVTLSAYQIEIARASRQTGFPVGSPAEDTTSALYSPGNTTGRFTGGPDATFMFSQTVNAGAPTTVGPNNGDYAPQPPGSLPSKGVVLVAPLANPPKANSDEFNPQPADAPWTNANTLRSGNPGPAMTSTGMGYTLTMSAAGAVAPGSTEYRRHVVLLRRRANPYVIDPATPTVPVTTANPVITGDMMDYVPSFDGLNRDVGQGNSRGPRTPAVQTGYDPTTERFSVGKVQPFAGHALSTPANAMPGTPNYNTYAFPGSMVLAQTTVPAANTFSAPKSTFGRHNGTGNAAPANTFNAGTPATLGDTLMAPFDWMIHLDRSLINEIELFQVRDTPPHLVTDRFLYELAGAMPGVTYEAGYGKWRFTNDGLARALEYLTVKPHMTGVPHGGRVPGKVGVNALIDKRVLNGLMDPQAGKTVDDNYISNRAWGTWMATRSGGVTPRLIPNGNSIQTTADPGQSIYDGTAGTGNRPFQSVGAPAVDPVLPGAPPGSEFAYVTGGNENLTILRNDGAATPHLFADLPGAGGRTAYGATYVPPEPLLKIRNNMTEVNHTYLVYLTIGYFELDFETLNPVTNQRDGLVTLGAGITMPRLAHEACLNVPGDLRQKFVAVIDMSNMAIDLSTKGPAAQPFFTTLEATARPVGGVATLSVATDASGSVVVDGTPVPIAAGSRLVLGYGSEEQVVDVTGVAAGQVTVSGMTRTAWAGSSVSNVQPGYPGVQGGNFRYNDPIYKPVIPYLERVK